MGAPSSAVVSPLGLILVAPFARAPKATTQARVLPLARALAARGHQVTVLVPPYDHPSEGGTKFWFGGARVVELAVPRGISESSPLQAVLQPMLGMALARRALALRPNVIHIFKPKAVSGLTQLLLWYGRAATGRARGSAIGGAKRPAIVLDTDDWEGFGGWNDYERYPWAQKAICDWQERWGLAHADAVTAASRTLQAQAWSHGVPPEKAIYFPNGLDLPPGHGTSRRSHRSAAHQSIPNGLDCAPGYGARLNRDSPAGLQGDDVDGVDGVDGVDDSNDSDDSDDGNDGADADQPYVDRSRRPTLLLYTRFFEFDVERVAGILERVRDAIPAVRLLVVGAGKFGQERDLAALTARRGLGDAVVLAGWQRAVTIPGLIAGTDVALFPADDNLANRAKCSVKLLEVLAAGVPVVADRVGQLAEYVQDGVNGLLSDPDQPETMASAAVRLLREPELARRYAVAGRARVAEHFTWEALALRAELAYARALATTS